MKRQERRQHWLRIHRDYVRDGVTIREVAATAGVDRKTVERAFKRYGLPVTRRVPFEPEWYPDEE